MKRRMPRLAAYAAGLLLAWAYAHPQAQPDRQWMERIGTELEGHADNVAAVILGTAEAAGLLAKITEDEGASLPTFFLFAVGFVILTAVLVLRPQGILGRLRG